MPTKSRDALKLIEDDKSLPTDEVANYVKTREKKQREGLRVNPANAIERLAARDPQFAAALAATKSHWLDRGNDILTELLDLVMVKARDPKTKLSELSRAIDVIATKLDIHNGVPTNSSVVHHTHTIHPAEMDDRAIEAEIIEIRSHMELLEEDGGDTSRG